MTSRIRMFVAVLLLIGVGSASADDFYVITGTYRSQKEAQNIAVSNGGWVLHSNFYNNLASNLFAVVRGPFKNKDEADKLLVWLTKGGRYPGSYVRNAGSINLVVKIGNKELSPQMIAALFGEIRIEVSESKGGSHPCEPQEPYKELSLSYATITKDYDKKKDKLFLKPREELLDVGAFREIKRTGEVQHMRICTE